MVSRPGNTWCRQHLLTKPSGTQNRCGKQRREPYIVSESACSSFINVAIQAAAPVGVTSHKSCLPLPSNGLKQRHEDLDVSWIFILCLSLQTLYQKSMVPVIRRSYFTLENLGPGGIKHASRATTDKVAELNTSATLNVWSSNVCGGNEASIQVYRRIKIE